MHTTCYAYVTGRVAAHELAGKDTLEVGSYNVNGTVRDLFNGPYVGLDMRKGPGVNVVADSYDMPFPDGRFEVVVST